MFEDIKIHRIETANQILKGFYVDNSENRRLGRVGMEYGSKERFDREGNEIGNGSWHKPVDIKHGILKKYKQVQVRTFQSLSTESSYVEYTNSENGKSVKVRFSDHVSNDIKNGAVLDSSAKEDEILYRLGLKERKFVVDKNTEKKIFVTMVSKKDLGKYEYCDKTMKELYQLPVGSDLSEYVGKLAKNSNYLIQSNCVEKNPFARGHYEYF